MARILWHCGVIVNVVAFMAGAGAFACMAIAYVRDSPEVYVSPYFGVMVYALLNLAALHPRTSSESSRIPMVILNGFLVAAGIVIVLVWGIHPHGDRIPDAMVPLAVIIFGIAIVSLGGLAARERRPG